jgi:phage N-6-adenine-methyltransferase
MWNPGRKRNDKHREYAVSPELFGPLMTEFRFTLDAAASRTNAQCPKFFTKQDNALVQNWGKGNVWCHAPKENLAAWVQKGYEASQEGATVVMLLPAQTSARWFHEIILLSRAEIRFIRGRLKFVRPDGSRSTSFFDSMLVVFRDHANGEIRRHGTIGQNSYGTG